MCVGECALKSFGHAKACAKGVVNAVAVVTKVRFGTVKVGFDISLIVIAGILSFMFFGSIHGLGVGTIVAAVITGQIVNLINRHCRFGPAREPVAACA